LKLENSGERFLPWTEVDDAHYEHVHRYFFASKFVKNKKVLDLACGEGYGVEIISKSAKSVIGIEIDKKTTMHAKKKYRAKNIKFITSSITEIPIPGKHLFDVIVCFEAIEHIKEQKKILQEVKRLIKKNGLFIISTPNKKVYRYEEKNSNPFHEKELSISEFRNLLKSFFSNVQIYGQKASTSSNIWPLSLKDKKNSQEIIVEKLKDNYILSKPEKKQPKYFVALASFGRLTSFKVGQSLLTDTGKLKTYASRLEHDLRKKNTELLKRASHIKKLEKDINDKASEILRNKIFLNKVEQDIKNKEDTFSSNKDYITKLKHYLQRKEDELTKSKDYTSKLKQEIQNKEAELTKSKDYPLKLKQDLKRKEDELTKSKEYTSKLKQEMQNKEAELTKSKDYPLKLKQDLQRKEDELTKSKDYTSKLKQEMQNKEAELTKSKDYTSKLKQEMQNKEAELTKINNAVSKLSEEIIDKNEVIKNLEIQLEELNENLGILKENRTKYFSSRL